MPKKKRHKEDWIIVKCLFSAAEYGACVDCDSVDGFVKTTNYFYKKEKH
ncbi:hypothetical protein MNB_SV-8-310 [hydrothermal vent metagenome]|uniref:Uncharacterized protein n=1 Tax=hydrothermal vent metagenome TaxID=652676 RepID=A0A1W1BNY3_9ZZZZ